MSLFHIPLQCSNSHKSNPDTCIEFATEKPKAIIITCQKKWTEEIKGLAGGLGSYINVTTLNVGEGFVEKVSDLFFTLEWGWQLDFMAYCKARDLSVNFSENPLKLYTVFILEKVYWVPYHWSCVSVLCLENNPFQSLTRYSSLLKKLLPQKSIVSLQMC